MMSLKNSEDHVKRTLPSHAVCEVISFLAGPLVRETSEELGPSELVRCFHNKKLQVGVVERTRGGFIIEIFTEF